MLRPAEGGMRTAWSVRRVDVRAVRAIGAGAAAIAVLVVGYLTWTWYGRAPVATGSAGPARRIVRYVDPMHPAFTSDRPGVAPDCGMALVPVYEGEAAPLPALAPGAITVSPGKQQLIGVRTSEVTRTAGRYTVRVLGRVVADETRVYPIHAATEGRVRDVLPITTGSTVEAGALLATVYPPEMQSLTRAYLAALATRDDSAAHAEALEGAAVYLDTYRSALRNIGMTEQQLAEIERDRRNPEVVEIRAPAAGVLVVRNLSPGERFEKGVELYRITDLSRVWVEAATFDDAATALQPGTAVSVSSPTLGRSFAAQVSAVPPTFDPASRALLVRLEADNPGLALRPGMFVDVALPIDYTPAIVVPADSVVDTGTAQIVYVAEGGGVFAPRRVETGWRHGEEVEIVAGLAPGEHIVVAGTFLLDSESRMRAPPPALTAESE